MTYQDTLERMFSETMVKDVMTKALISVDPVTTLYQISKMMEQGGMGSILVKKDGIPSGIITDRDFAVKIAAHAYQITEPVKKIMSSPLFSIGSDETVRTAADLMHDRKIRKLPVIDDGKVVGIITSTDIVNLLAVCVEDDMRDMYFHSIAKIYTNYSPYN